MESKNALYFTTPPALVGRNRRIVELVDEGKTLAEIARMYGLTAARVWQIVDRDRKQRMQAA